MVRGNPYVITSLPTPEPEEFEKIQSSSIVVKSALSEGIFA